MGPQVKPQSAPQKSVASISAVNSQTMKIVRKYRDAETESSNFFREICEHVHENGVPKNDLKEAFMAENWMNEQTGRNEVSKILQDLCYRRTLQPVCAG